MRPYKAVFLDWDDTIGDFRHAELLALRDIYAAHGLERLYPTFEDYYNTYHPHNLMLWDRYGRSETSKQELQLDRFLYPLLHASLRREEPSGTAADAETEARTMGDEFLQLTNRYFRLLPGAEETVRHLAARYPLTIVSNGFTEVQYTKIRLSGLQDCFRHVVLSEETGWQKPNPLIFSRALDLNGLQAEDVLMVGDSWNSDIQGARNAGIDQLWITTDLQDPRPSTYRTTDIRDLKDLL
ncbi:MAG: YjjG family noncanonical pyrimidine nucleotidase [Paludibacteraceae bacterium]|nr:YjjG family noncanonical pyrimidine nucleotidase [Paludibacteraceae bacterium]